MNGGGVYIDNLDETTDISGTARFDELTFSNNKSDLRGGELFNANNDLVADTANFSKNAAENSSVGGGMFGLLGQGENGGIGDGVYSYSQVVNVSADLPPSAQIFDQWTGDAGLLANPLLPDTTVSMPDAEIVMPSENIAVSATYKERGDTSYLLAVIDGTVVDTENAVYAYPGNKIFFEASVPKGFHFVQLLGQIFTVGDPRAASTHLLHALGRHDRKGRIRSPSGGRIRHVLHAKQHLRNRRRGRCDGEFHLRSYARGRRSDRIIRHRRFCGDRAFRSFDNRLRHVYGL